MLEGGCFCGRIRYRVNGEPGDETVCHCSICRRVTGAPFVAWFTVPRSQLELIGVEPASFQSSPRATRRFCSNCGTQLTFETADAPEEIDITTSSLDRPEQAPPKSHIWTSTRVPWIELSDQLPQFRGRRQQE